MKKIAILALASLVFFSCKKKTEILSVKFVTTGEIVTQFKVYNGSTVGDKAVPFSGTQDTTLTVSPGTTVKIDAKANGNLSSSIFLNGVQVATGTDPDLDGDGKTQVKIEYAIPQ